MKITGDFEVNGVSFADWFNNSFRIRNRKAFTNAVQKENFQEVMRNIQALTNKEDISLGEFVGHFCIIYNETGGRFEPMRERGSLEYLFEARKNKKVSYNREKINNWKTGNRLAGKFLEENFEPKFTNEVYASLNKGVYPNKILLALPELLPLLGECDFHKYRGGGLKQLTWRANYLAFVQPLLDKDLDDISDAELSKLLEDISLNCKIFNQYIHSSGFTKRAINKLEKGDFADYGYAIAGRKAHRYVNYFYLPRCKRLFKALQNSDLGTYELFHIDNEGLTPFEIQNIQEALLKFAPNEEAELLESNGGMDGIWGNVTERVFKNTNLETDHLLTLGIRENLFTFSELSGNEIRKVQEYIVENGSSRSRYLIESNGGTDGIAGKATREAFKLSKRMFG